MGNTVDKDIAYCTLDSSGQDTGPDNIHTLVLLPVLLLVSLVQLLLLVLKLYALYPKNTVEKTNQRTSSENQKLTRIGLPSMVVSLAATIALAACS